MFIPIIIQSDTKKIKAFLTIQKTKSHKRHKNKTYHCETLMPLLVFVLNYGVLL